MSRLIAVDIGHGANTYEETGGKGVTRNGEIFEEHSFNADVGIRIRKLLEYNDFKVVFTQQPNESDVGLAYRTDLANAKKVDFLLSIHANASSNSTASGACAFYWHTSEEGKRFAELYIKNLKERKINTHGSGIHKCIPGTWSNFWMIRKTTMIAILTENGFMTNDKDLEYLKSDDYRQAIAEAHAQAVCEYFNQSYSLPSKTESKSQALTWEEELAEAVDFVQRNNISDGTNVNEPMTRGQLFVILKRLDDKFRI